MPLASVDIGCGISTNVAVALLLEDEPLIAMDLELTLGNVGLVVDTVTSCEDAKKWLAERRPDIAVVDIQLVDGPSHEVVEKLVLYRVPFIVHSGDHPSMHADTPFVHGHWISKPADPVELLAVTRKLLSKAR